MRAGARRTAGLLYFCMPGEIRVGTASWTDPGFIAKWYPKRFPASERLRWYADHFNLVELNSSFYAIPSKAQAQKWCRDTPDDFLFDIKLHRLLSRHAASAQTLPPDLRPLAKITAGKVQLTQELEQAVAKRFCEEISPIRDAGKMGALLLQLSPSFSPRTNKLSELNGLLDVLSGWKVALELRNRNWVVSERTQETLRFFAKRGIALVSVDAPAGSHFMIMPSEDYLTTPDLAYLRLHGRNAEGYLKGRTVGERFNYLYAEEEVEATAARVERMAKQASRVHVIYNNNAEDYAPRNATDLVRVLKRMDGTGSRV